MAKKKQSTIIRKDQTTRSLPVDLTVEQVGVLNLVYVTGSSQLRKLESEKGDALDVFNGKIKTLKAELKQTLTDLEAGERTEDVICEIQWDPETHQVSTVRTDTGVVIDYWPMNPEEITECEQTDLEM